MVIKRDRLISETSALKFGHFLLSCRRVGMYSYTAGVKLKYWESVPSAD